MILIVFLLIFQAIPYNVPRVQEVAGIRNERRQFGWSEAEP